MTSHSDAIRTSSDQTDVVAGGDPGAGLDSSALAMLPEGRDHARLLWGQMVLELSLS